MSALLPFDLTEIVQTELEKQRREPDGLLHASSHLTGSIRHAQLDVAGAPKSPDGLMPSIRMMTGTLWHQWLQERLKSLGVFAAMEVNLTPWLPPMWGGTADFVIWNDELGGFVLVDLKTTKGESIRYVRDGAKEEHIWQTSAYWYALKARGLPMVKREAIYYLPMNDTRTGGIEPILIDFEPLDKAKLDFEMGLRAGHAFAYVSSIDPEGPANPGKFLTDELEPVQKREQKLRWDRRAGHYVLWLEPHWSAQFCKFPHELCDCSTQEKTRIGVFDEHGEYHPRPGYEDIEPTVFPIS